MVVVFGGPAPPIGGGFGAGVPVAPSISSVTRVSVPHGDDPSVESTCSVAGVGFTPVGCWDAESEGMDINRYDFPVFVVA